MNYSQAMDYFEQTKQYGSVLGLENIRELCRRLGNPQDGLRFIHVAGTNGKGSTCAFLCNILKEAGYRTGCYSSPAVFCYEERYRVDGRNISKAMVARLLTQIKEEAEAMTADGLPHPTTFEIETALAFLFFWEKKCDMVVLETGMGGDLDATNIIRTPVVSVLTSISMDHMGFLGKTITEITEKKAGIIKENSRAVSIRQREECLEVIRERAKKMNSPLILADDHEAELISRKFPGLIFRYHGEEWELQMSGDYQVKNAVLALTVCSVLKELNFSITLDHMKKGLKRCLLPGRLSVLEEKPLFLIDGAHNEEAAISLEKSIKEYFPGKRLIFIIGVLKDKEYEKVILHTVTLASEIITVTPPWPERALTALELAQTVMKYNPRVTAADSLEDAVEMAHLLADRDSIIIAFGSLSFLGRLHIGK